MPLRLTESIRFIFRTNNNLLPLKPYKSSKNQLFDSTQKVRKYSPTLMLTEYVKYFKRQYSKNYRISSSRDDAIMVPSFEGKVREVNDPESNRQFSYLMVGGSTVLGAIAAKSTVFNFLSTWEASSEALALSQIEIDLSPIPVGKSVIMKWRGKPIFIRHRSSEEIEEANSVPLTELRDPQSDCDRVKKPEWIIMVGICTHLGCVPLANSGLYNGWYCPCHGSHYDISGRIRKGPAPLNMEVPLYKFIDNSTVLIG